MAPDGVPLTPAGGLVATSWPATPRRNSTPSAQLASRAITPAPDPVTGATAREGANFRARYRLFDCLDEPFRTGGTPLQAARFGRRLSGQQTLMDQRDADLVPRRRRQCAAERCPPGAMANGRGPSWHSLSVSTLYLTY